MVVSDRVEVLGVERGKGEKKRGLVRFWKRQRKRVWENFRFLELGEGRALWELFIGPQCEWVRTGPLESGSDSSV